jgi:hypothetical protein
MVKPDTNGNKGPPVEHVANHRIHALGADLFNLALIPSSTTDQLAGHSIVPYG